MAKDKKRKHIFKRLDDALDSFIGKPKVMERPEQQEVTVHPQKILPPIVKQTTKTARQINVDIFKKEQDQLNKDREEAKKQDDAKAKTKKESKPETMTSVKKRVEGIVKKHLENIPSQSRVVNGKDIRKWVMENPAFNINSPQFLAWCRNPDGEGVCPFVKHFGSLLTELGIDHACDVDVRGYVYDFFIEPMKLYIDIDPISLETDDPNAKISITVNKNKLDVLGIWRDINESRGSRCKPYRFMAIKERLYSQGVKEFIQEYLDWYYQQMINKEKV